MRTLLKLKLGEALRAVGPLIAVVCLLQVTVIGTSAELFLQFLAGSVLVTLGMLLLFAGVDFGVLPMGRFIGGELPRKGSLSLLLAVAFAMGFATTAAEPDVIVLAGQVEEASQGGLSAQPLVYTIAAGVGLFTAVALLRVVRGFSMAWQLTVVYSVMLALTLVAPSDLVPLAYDAGSVTTGVLAGPVVLALALGVSSVLAGRSAVADGFGLLGMASAGPIIVILLLGLLR
ncbi:MAG: DUF1538 domain-containing protein [Pseudomonadota bacterium]|jgi:Protein of unknown function (DUF1538).|nr:MAG: DUF1538 domain-containing protein [Pseudomonadota bacterium]